MLQANNRPLHKYKQYEIGPDGGISATDFGDPGGIKIGNKPNNNGAAPPSK